MNNDVGLDESFYLFTYKDTYIILFYFNNKSVLLLLISWFKNLKNTLVIKML